MVSESTGEKSLKMNEQSNMGFGSKKNNTTYDYSDTDAFSKKKQSVFFVMTSLLVVYGVKSVSDLIFVTQGILIFL